MAQEKGRFVHKIYFRSMQEYEYVRVHAKLSGAGSVSNFARDAILSYIRQAPYKADLPQEHFLNQQFMNNPPPIVEEGFIIDIHKDEENEENISFESLFEPEEKIK